jgi:hypothetical protein
MEGRPIAQPLCRQAYPDYLVMIRRSIVVVHETHARFCPTLADYATGCRTSVADFDPIAIKRDKS